MPSKDLKVTLLGDDRTGGAFSSAGRNADGLGKKFAGLGKGIALAMGGAAVAGIAGVGAAMFQGFKDAASYEKITAQVAQTIKSTGAAAGVTADGIKKYAGELESMSGVDEELILSGQNVLLTFTNIRNGVGKGNDIFDQASEAALNLSTTMGGDLVGANTLVGKALNDPLKGMTALRRAGVQLTEAQQDQIKAMVESGDVMGAQKVLLGELETQFGGAAKAAGSGLTGSIARAKDAFQDMFRGIATAVLPALTEFMQFVADRLIPGLQGLYDLIVKGDFTAALREAFGWDEDSGIVTFLFGVRDAVIAVKDAFTGAGGEAGGAMSKVQEAIRAVVEFAGPAFETLKGIFADVVTIVSALWNAFGQDIVNSVMKAWQTIGPIIQGALDFIKGVLDVFIGLFSGDWSRMWDGIKGIVTGAFSVIKGIFEQFLNITNTLASMALTALKNIFSAAWDGIKAAAGAAWNGIRNALSAAWNGIVNAVSSGVSSVVSYVAGMPGRVLSGLGNIGSLLLSAGADLIRGFLNGIKNMAGAVADAAKNVAKGAVNGVKSFLGINSPSKVFAELGTNVGQGFVNGIAGMRPAVAAEMQRLADTQALTSGPLSLATSARPAAPGEAFAAAPVGAAASSSTPSAPAVHIENYNEARQPVHDIAQEFAFLARTR